MAKEIKEKTDILGQPIVVGCYVVVPRRNSLLICKVIKITEKMVHVESTKKTWHDTFMVYPTDSVRLDGPDVLAYILRG